MLTTTDKPVAPHATSLNFPRIFFLVGIAFVAAAFAFFLYWQFENPTPKPVWFAQEPGNVDSAVYSRNGRFVMTVDEARGVTTVRNAATGEIVGVLGGGYDQSWISSDGSRVLQTDLSPKDGTRCALRVVATGQVLRQWTGQVLDVTPDLSLMLAADDYIRSAKPADASPKVGRVVDVASGRVVGHYTFGLFWINGMSRDGRYVYHQRYDAPAQLLRVPSMTSVLQLPSLRAMRLSRDDKYLVGLTPDGKLQRWVLGTGQQKSMAVTGFRGPDIMYLLDDGTIVISGTQGAPGKLRSVMEVRSADGQRLLHSFSEAPESFSPGGNFVAFGRWSKAGVNVANVETGRNTTLVPEDPLGRPLPSSIPAPDYLAIAPDGKHFVYGTHNGLLVAYDLGQTRTSHGPVSTSPGRSTDVTGVGVNRDDLDTQVSTSVTRTGSGSVVPAIQSLNGHTYQLEDTAALPSGQALVAVWELVQHANQMGPYGIGNEGGALLDLRDAHTGELIRRFLWTHEDGSQARYTGDLSHPALSKDNRFVAATDDSGNILIWDTSTGLIANRMSGAIADSSGVVDPGRDMLYGAKAALAFSPDGHFLAAARNDGSIYLYSLRTNLPVAQIGQVAETMSGSDGTANIPLQCIAFSEDGHTLYGTIRGQSGGFAWDVPQITP